MSTAELLREIERVLTRPIRWMDAANAEMKTRGAKAYSGISQDGNWNLLVVSFTYDDSAPPHLRGSRGHDGTASRAAPIMIVRLTPALAERAFKLADAACSPN